MGGGTPPKPQPPPPPPTIADPDAAAARERARMEAMRRKGRAASVYAGNDELGGTTGTAPGKPTLGA